MYAMVAQRHMHLYGTTNDHLGAIAVAERQWANRNPAAQFHDTPMTLDGLPPLALGGGAVPSLRLLPGVERRPGGDRHQRRAGARPANSRRSTCSGMGQGHPGGDPVETLTSGAPLAKEAAFAHGRHHARRHRRRRALRLLHVHRARHARGLRLLREGRGRPVRRRRPHRARAARCRSTPAAGSCRRSTCGA